MTLALTPEDIMKRTYAGLETFLQKLLNARDFQAYIEYKQTHFPTWQHMWGLCEPWLKNHVFGDMNQTIQSLARVIPNSQVFHHQLLNSIQLHEEFWNKVYANLRVAKERYPAS